MALANALSTKDGLVFITDKNANSTDQHEAIINPDALRAAGVTDIYVDEAKYHYWLLRNATEHKAKITGNPDVGEAPINVHYTDGKYDKRSSSGDENADSFEIATSLATNLIENSSYTQISLAKMIETLTSKIRSGKIAESQRPDISSKSGAVLRLINNPENPLNTEVKIKLYNRWFKKFGTIDIDGLTVALDSLVSAVDGVVDTKGYKETILASANKNNELVETARASLTREAIQQREADWDSEQQVKHSNEFAQYISDTRGSGKFVVINDHLDDDLLGDFAPAFAAKGMQVEDVDIKTADLVPSAAPTVSAKPTAAESEPVVETQATKLPEMTAPKLVDVSTKPPARITPTFKSVADESEITAPHPSARMGEFARAAEELKPPAEEPAAEERRGFFGEKLVDPPAGRSQFEDATGNYMSLDY